MDFQDWILSPTLIAACIISICLFITRQHGVRRLDQREPIVVQPTIPYIGHLLGMIAFGGRYSKKIASKYFPIFTMPLPGSRMYIVTDPALAATVQKTKSLSFNPIIPQVTQRVLGLDKETLEILATNMGREDGHEGFYPEVRDLVYSNMTPGDRLDELTSIAVRVFRKHLENYASKLKSSPTSTSVEDLLLWTQHTVTVATAEFLYGPSNPIAANPSLESSFWDFDHGLGQLLAFASLVPSITARKAYLGRETMVSALTKYFESGTHTSGSAFIQHRVKIAQKYGMSIDGIARSELSFLFAGIVNTAVTSFWLIVRIFANPELLRTLQVEIEKCKKDSTDLDPGLLANSCPVLLSVYRETLRLSSDNSSNRLVVSDTLLADTYFLAKDSVVQISGAAMHVDKRNWGDSVESFDPYRFMPERLKEMHVHPATFRAFGGGATICPGRHFATREILYFVALVLQLFELEAVGGGTIDVPDKKDNVLPVHILEPKKKVMVQFKLRV